MKEGQNNSTPGFRSDRELHQHAIHKRIMPPHQTLTKTMTGIQCRWNTKQKWGYQTLHRPRNADGKPKSVTAVFPH